jgi:enterochelin esterase family protein
MKKFLYLLATIIFAHAGHAQETKSLLEYVDFWNELREIYQTKDIETKKNAVDKFWNNLKSKNKIPFVIGNYCALLYRGEAESISFQGDFSGWGRLNNESFSAIRIPDTDLWILEKDFPEDARLDYKIVIDKKEWILDPNNPNSQVSGFGINSELRMPKWKESEWAIKNNNIKTGTTEQNIRIHSKSLGYDLLYHTYLPHNYENLKELPVIYVTDGHEYMANDKGSMVVVLDNLIAKNKIKPVIAIFIDPRDPDSLHINRRESNFLMNENFLNFVCEELVPYIDFHYKTNKSAHARAILGTSYGGVCATYFSVSRSDVFKLAAIQSPAYRNMTNLLQKVIETEDTSVKYFMSTGTINDGESITRMVHEHLLQKKLIYCTKRVTKDTLGEIGKHCWMICLFIFSKTAKLKIKVII